MQQKNINNQEIHDINIEIYSMFGNLLQKTIVSEGQSIDISKLPVGVYNVLIKTDGLKTETESLIKMK